jgi:flagellar biosynthesis protein FlhG
VSSVQSSTGFDQASRLRALIDGLDAAGPAKRTPASLGPAFEPATNSRCRVISVSSGKGGVGKTNIAVSLAIALARRGLRATLLDADLGVANADVICGVNPRVRIERVLSDRAAGAPTQLRDVAIDVPGGFKLIPGSVGLSRMADLTPAQRSGLIEAMVQAEANCDVMIVDTGAGVGALVRSMISAADLSLIVTTPEPTALADAYALIKCIKLSGQDAQSLAVIVNQAQDQRESEQVYQRLNAVCKKFLGLDPPLAGWVAQDALLARAVRMRRPILLESPTAPSARTLVALADTVAALAQLDAPADQARPKGWWSRLFGG